MNARVTSSTLLFWVAASRHIVFIYKYRCQHLDTRAGLLLIYHGMRAIRKKSSQHTLNIWQQKGIKCGQNVAWND